jgi:ribitol-5-phosphate 2-dehydrogenase (NADP+) / D-ribitol-5-phosphate cytidylyltransferase
MGGAGERFGDSTPKQFHRLAGKKIYLHTLETFLSSKLFEEILLVCPEQWIEAIRADLHNYPLAPITLVTGGATRQHSSLNGLLACGATTQYVVIHDAVRPFVTEKILRDNIAGALEHQAVDTCISSADTLVFAPGNTQITDIPKRADYLRGQTPQSFAYPLILKAHLQAKEDGIQNSSDDCSLVLRLPHPIFIVQGEEQNLKITSELDLFLAEQILRLKNTSSTALQEHTSLKGKRIAVTGGTGGIGKEICRLLAEEGAIPLSLSRSSSTYPVDLTSYSATRSLFETLFKEHGELDGLINSIGLLKNEHVDALTSEEIDRLIATNLTGVIYSCRCACLKKGAHIINIASSSYSRGRKNHAIYSSAKAAVVNFTQGLSEEREDLLVNALVPQRTDTPMRQSNFPGEDPATLLSPTLVAQEIVSLLKQSALTGTIVEVKMK